MKLRDDLGTRMKAFYEEIPIFKGENREYIEKLVYVGEK